MGDFDEWVAAVSELLGLTAGLDAPPAVDTVSLLAVSRDVAHGVSRPATPVTAYLMGLAVGGGSDPAAVTAAVTALAAGWVSADPAADD